jgi:hypothetical protein
LDADCGCPKCVYGKSGKPVQAYNKGKVADYIRSVEKIAENALIDLLAIMQYCSGFAEAIFIENSLLPIGVPYPVDSAAVARTADSWAKF